MTDISPNENKQAFTLVQPNGRYIENGTGKRCFANCHLWESPGIAGGLPILIIKLLEIGVCVVNRIKNDIRKNVGSTAKPQNGLVRGWGNPRVPLQGVNPNGEIDGSHLKRSGLRGLFGPEL
jgi:hypothetical protein